MKGQTMSDKSLFDRMNDAARESMGRNVIGFAPLNSGSGVYIVISHNPDAVHPYAIHAWAPNGGLYWGQYMRDSVEAFQTFIARVNTYKQQ